jgi:hypothetical protein
MAVAEAERDRRNASKTIFARSAAPRDTDRVRGAVRPFSFQLTFNPNGPYDLANH